MLDLQKTWQLTDPEQQAIPLFFGGSGGVSPTRSGDGVPSGPNTFSSEKHSISIICR